MIQPSEGIATALDEIPPRPQSSTINTKQRGFLNNIENSSALAVGTNLLFAVHTKQTRKWPMRGRTRSLQATPCIQDILESNLSFHWAPSFESPHGAGSCLHLHLHDTAHPWPSRSPQAPLLMPAWDLPDIQCEHENEGQFPLNGTCWSTICMAGDQYMLGMLIFSCLSRSSKPVLWPWWLGLRLFREQPIRHRQILQSQAPLKTGL